MDIVNKINFVSKYILIDNINKLNLEFIPNKKFVGYNTKIKLVAYINAFFLIFLT